MAKSTKRIDRLGEEKLNNQGFLMKVIEYNERDDIIVEFQNEYKTKIHTTYKSFKNGTVRNPYCTSIFGVGVTGNKYPTWKNGKITKEYSAWSSMLNRCFNKKYKEKHITYKDVVICNEWLFYENFYEWLHSQDNFDKWLNNDKWTLDKDILMKSNKIYSPETCCLTPMNVNNLFTKSNKTRGGLPIGVKKDGKRFRAVCSNPFTSKRLNIGSYGTPEEAFQAYKMAKENIIKQVAQDEYDKGNITRPCYEAMMEYEVEITD